MPWGVEIVGSNPASPTFPCPLEHQFLPSEMPLGRLAKVALRQAEKANHGIDYRDSRVSKTPPFLNRELIRLHINAMFLDKPESLLLALTSIWGSTILQSLRPRTSPWTPFLDEPGIRHLAIEE